MNSLSMLTELRAIKPRMTLLHIIVDMVEKDNPGLLDFTEEFSCVKEAQRTVLESLANELQDWKKQIDELVLELAHTDQELVSLMDG